MAVNEAKLVEKQGGLEPRGDGWFVVNAAEAPWWRHETFGASAYFEGEKDFPELGVRLKLLWPGQPNGVYHREESQEDFLVLSGECLLLLEEEERRLRAWGFVHCPAGTEHIFVGAGSGPSLILIVGSRPDGGILYPVSELARRHGASVEEETTEPDRAYSRFPEGETGPMPDGVLPSLGHG